MSQEKRTSKLFGSRISSIFSTNEAHHHLKGSEKPPPSPYSTRGAPKPLFRPPLSNQPSAPDSFHASQTPVPQIQTEFGSASAGEQMSLENRRANDLKRLETNSSTKSSPRVHRKPPPADDFYLDSPKTSTRDGHSASPNPLNQQPFTDIIGELDQEIGLMNLEKYPKQEALASPSDPVPSLKPFRTNEGTKHTSPTQREMFESPQSKLLPTHQSPMAFPLPSSEFLGPLPRYHNLHQLTQDATEPHFLHEDTGSKAMRSQTQIQGSEPEYDAESDYLSDIIDAERGGSSNYGSKEYGIHPSVSSQSASNPNEHLDSVYSASSKPGPLSSPFELGVPFEVYSDSVQSASSSSKIQPGDGDGNQMFRIANNYLFQDNQSSNAFTGPLASGLSVELTSSVSSDPARASSSKASSSSYLGGRAPSDSITPRSNILGSVSPERQSSSESEMTPFGDSAGLAPGTGIADLIDSYQIPPENGSVANRYSTEPSLPLKMTELGVGSSFSQSLVGLQKKSAHTRMLSFSSIYSGTSNRHVNLATLKRSFSLRPGEGDRSSYVDTIRKNAGTAYNDAGSGKWKLPTGIMPVDNRNILQQANKRFNRNSNGGARAMKSSGVELKHGHLQRRLLAAEVDDGDNTNRFGALGRSSTLQNKSLTPETSKSSTPSAGLSGVSRTNSLERADTIASMSTAGDIQSLRSRLTKSRRGSTASIAELIGSINDSRRVDIYYQHPSYKFDDRGDGLDTDEFTHGDEVTNGSEYEDDDEKPRLFLANPDSSWE